MTQPTPFIRSFNFTDFSAANPSAQVPGFRLDAELSAIGETLGGTLANLALIQRDDGKLANGSVHVDALSAEARSAVGFTDFVYDAADAVPQTLYTLLGGLPINPKGFGALFHPLADDTNAFKKALAFAALLGGATVLIPPTTYPARISDTLPISQSGVKLLCSSPDDFHVYAPEWANEVNTSTSSGVMWVGAAGGTVVDICPTLVSPGVWNDRGGGISGIEVDLKLFAGPWPHTSVAARGVRARAVSWSKFRVTGVEFSDAALVLEAMPGRPLDQNYQNSCTWNWIEGVGFRNVAGPGGGLRLDGADAFGGNAFQNRGGMITGIHNNGTAVDFAACDNSTFEQVRIQRIDGGTGLGVVFRAGTSASLRSNVNTIKLCSPGAGGVVAQGTPTAAFPSISNRIDMYNPDENGAPAAPLIEAGATLFWTSAHKMGGGAATARPSGNQSIPNATTTKVNLNTQLINDGCWDATNSRYSPKFPGPHLCHAEISMTFAAAGNVSLTLVTSLGIVSRRHYREIKAAGTYGIAVTGIPHLNGIGEHVEVQVQQNTGAAATVNMGVDETYFDAARMS